MVEAVMFWNEPNNKSHWAFELDPKWQTFGDMVKLASAAVRAENPRLQRVLGGMSPIDPNFVENMRAQGVLDVLDVLAVHGFPLDWNHWCIDEWPEKIKQIQALTTLPVWVSEVGVSTFGAEEVQEFGLQRTFELLAQQTARVHWYSLYDLPRAWPATTRHREAEGSAYYRHFYMGLLREDGTPKRALKQFANYTPRFGICQWFHFEDHRLDDAVHWLHKLGVKYLRTGLSWADSFRPNAEAWFDRQMKALDEFDVTLTYCFTPEHRGLEPHHTSPPQQLEEYAEFCAAMTRRYASGVAGAHPHIKPATPCLTSMPTPDGAVHREETPASPALVTSAQRLWAWAKHPSPHTVIVAAHPDDEVIGAGAQLPRLHRATLLHLTDGAPGNLADALQAGCTSRDEYAALRRQELENVLNIVGLKREQAICLGIQDQEASLHLPELSQQLARYFLELRPEVVLTHAYEGGHPDHDAAAFCVHAACHLLESQNAIPPLIIEMTAYHGPQGRRITGRFLPDSDAAYFWQTLTPEQQALKRRLLDAYVSQRAVLDGFAWDYEQYRTAPKYDFTREPHGGRLFYENFSWGTTGATWRDLARKALQRLALPSQRGLAACSNISRLAAGEVA